MEQPGNTAQESLVQIFKIEQTTVPTSAATVDFSDNTLLAAAFQDTNVHPTEVVVFDNEIFNQDVYITYTDNGSGTNEDVNYYIELEQIKLALDENTVATLKDIRNIEAQNV
jgi:predicted secreted protein